jgi:hypothetical protein
MAGQPVVGDASLAVPSSSIFVFTNLLLQAGLSKPVIPSLSFQA